MGGYISNGEKETMEEREEEEIGGEEEGKAQEYRGDQENSGRGEENKARLRGEDGIRRGREDK